MLSPMRAAYVAAALLATAAALGALLMPSRYVPAEAIPHQDKLEHLTLFATLTCLWRAAGASPVAAFATAVALGAGSELAQAAMHWGRTGDIHDFAADLLGAGLGLLACRLAAGRRAAAP